MKNRVTTGWFRPRKAKRQNFITTMVCLETDCGHLWDASCISNPCPQCGSGSVIPADNWNFGRKGCLKLGKVKS